MAVERLDGRGGQLVGAEGGIIGERDFLAAGDGHHVVEGGDILARAGKRRRRHGMAVDDGLGGGKAL